VTARKALGGKRFGRRTPRVLAVALVVAALALAAGCTGQKAPSVSSDAGTKSPTPVAGIAANLQPLYMQQLHWKGCGDSFQCSKLTVPMDYTNPSAGSFHLALIRLPASDQKHRIGSLVINPGGPGGSGVTYARAAEQVISSAVRKRYDIVGFDPRGVGASDPVQCLSNTELDAFLAADPTPTTPDQIATSVALAQQLADGCKTRVGKALEFVGTRDAAHDIDVLRSALGDAKLHYLGKSYGTFLGATYAEEFPSNVGTMVLDGVIDPALTSSQINLGQAQGFELATRSFMADCIKHSGCPMGTSVDAGMASLRAFLDGLDAKPLPTNDPQRQLTEGWASLGVAYPMYSPSLWPELRTALSSALKGNGTPLMILADSYADRSGGGGYTDNLMTALYAVNCQDRAQPGGVAGIEKDAQTFAPLAPTWGAQIAWGSLPCVYWPNKPTDTPHPIRAEGSGPILVIGTTRDPATPYAWAVSTAKELANGHLLTRNGDGHTAYREGNPCIDTAVDAYLLKGAVPPAGKAC
jgi:pimeloyl-ACP methyl ester carboxylesterase